MTDVLPYVMLLASGLAMLWRVRARLLYGCDIMLALARGLYHRKNIYLADGFKCGHLSFHIMISNVSSLDECSFGLIYVHCTACVLLHARCQPVPTSSDGTVMC